MNNKLNSLSKIIVATGTINYLANSMYSVNKEMKMIPDKDGIHINGIKEKDELLELTVKKLGEIMEELADCLNNCDAVMPIDDRITAEAFEIMHGNDDIE